MVKPRGRFPELLHATVHPHTKYVRVDAVVRDLPPQPGVQVADVPRHQDLSLCQLRTANGFRHLQTLHCLRPRTARWIMVSSSTWMSSSETGSNSRSMSLCEGVRASRTALLSDRTHACSTTSGRVRSRRWARSKRRRTGW